MASTKQEFKLDETLEGLLNNVNLTAQSLSQGRNNPDMANIDTRNELAKRLGDKSLKVLEPTLFVDRLEALKGDSYTSLESNLDEATYKTGVAHYTTALRPEFKERFYYVEMLKEGVAPAKPSDELKGVLGRIGAATKAKALLDAKNVEGAKDVLTKYITRSQQTHLDIDALTASPYGRVHAEGVIQHIIEAQYDIAAMTIKEKGLYNEIDSAVKDKPTQARSFVAAYNAYNTQKHYDEEAAKAKAKAGKK